MLVGLTFLIVFQAWLRRIRGRGLSGCGSFWGRGRACWGTWPKLKLLNEYLSQLVGLGWSSLELLLWSSIG